MIEISGISISGSLSVTVLWLLVRHGSSEGMDGLTIDNVIPKDRTHVPIVSGDLIIESGVGGLMREARLHDL